MRWKFTDATNVVAFRTFEDGRVESCLASALPEGTEVLPADPPTQPSAAEQIATLERETLLARPTREFMLGMMVQLAAQQGVTEAQLYAANPGYRKVKDLDEQIKALRSGL